MFVYSGNYDDALSTLAEMKSTPPPLHALNLTLVEFSAAGLCKIYNEDEF